MPIFFGRSKVTFFSLSISSSLPGYAMTHTVTGVGDTSVTETVKIRTHTAYRPEEGAIQYANKGAKYLPKSDTC